MVSNVETLLGKPVPGVSLKFDQKNKIVKLVAGGKITSVHSTGRTDEADKTNVTLQVGGVDIEFSIDGKKVKELKTNSKFTKLCKFESNNNFLNFENFDFLTVIISRNLKISLLFQVSQLHDRFPDPTRP